MNGFTSASRLAVVRHRLNSALNANGNYSKDRGSYSCRGKENKPSANKPNGVENNANFRPSFRKKSIGSNVSDSYHSVKMEVSLFTSILKADVLLVISFIIDYIFIMNTEKEITITELRGKFTKDFDTFGKMVRMAPCRIPLLSLLLASVSPELKRLMVLVDLDRRW